MTSHLLALTVGPVQDFIAAARRTRDLWFGSYLLSEISKAAAKSVRDQGGKLIFPVPASNADLEPRSPLNVANVIVAELDGGDPPAIARAAKEAAQRRWRDFADQVFNHYQGVIRADIWNDQVGDVIEFYPQYAAFPFEGTVLFRSRHRDLREEAEIAADDSAFAQLVNALDVISRAAKEKGLPAEPSPYLGVLVADGDRMGAALSRLASPDGHRQFSQALAGFAGEAARIVGEHQGVLVYSGGDDVLAFVPVDRCLGCARELHDAFGSALARWSTAEGPLTLSVGLAIAHFMEPLEDLLGYGRAAEKHAKHPRRGDVGQADRNGLAVHVDSTPSTSAATTTKTFSP